MTQPDYVRVGLAHLAPDRSQPAQNRAALIEAVRHAADLGAQLVLAPELAVAGYGFGSVQEARAVAEPRHGPTLDALEKVCSGLGVWCAAGYLERDPDGSLFNSAMLVSPTGLAGHHRKLVAESRWASRGEPAQARPIDTPWGPVGLLICADTYYAGPARALRLRGAKALLVPSNWPCGDLDPRRIWRARAAENGIPVLVANRTGVDGQFDARSASSAIYDAQGATRAERSSPTPQVLVHDMPLAEGMWCERAEALSGRRPQTWATLAGGPAPEHPGDEREPGTRPGTRVRVVVGRSGGDGADAPELLVVAPGREVADDAAPVVIGSDTEGAFACVSGRRRRPERAENAVVARAGSLLVAAVDLRDGRHPEATLALVERGVDLIVVSAHDLSAQERELMLLRALDRSAVAVVSPHIAQLAIPPLDHAAPEVLTCDSVLEARLAGGWSARAGGDWKTAHILDREALCQSGL
ncbi:carbon-nitrogen hydrolase family protein [Gephyromycinifex aptenodytis]|uniref:carbon-nitrogen hydrolase family protein n=1 Tax=Gephyromycinifex aptenodytis TaxID=2716227 RepID=UPI00144646CC|nr:carbon-nitrogen hydrolase family protein [Gephyromycinifex aptenodytis]